MKSDDSFLRFALMNVLYSTWNYSEKGRDPWVGRVGDGMADKEQKVGKMGENSPLVSFMFFCFILMCLLGDCFLPEVLNIRSRISRAVSSQICLRF